MPTSTLFVCCSTFCYLPILLFHLPLFYHCCSTVPFYSVGIPVRLVILVLMRSTLPVTSCVLMLFYHSCYSIVILFYLMILACVVILRSCSFLPMIFHSSLFNYSYYRVCSDILSNILYSCVYSVSTVYSILRVSVH